MWFRGCMHVAYNIHNYYYRFHGITHNAHLNVVIWFVVVSRPLAMRMFYDENRNEYNFPVGSRPLYVIHLRFKGLKPFFMISFHLCSHLCVCILNCMTDLNMEIRKTDQAINCILCAVKHKQNQLKYTYSLVLSCSKWHKQYATVSLWNGERFVFENHRVGG